MIIKSSLVQKIQKSSKSSLIQKFPEIQKIIVGPKNPKNHHWFKKSKIIKIIIDPKNSRNPKIQKSSIGSKNQLVLGFAYPKD